MLKIPDINIKSFFSRLNSPKKVFLAALKIFLWIFVLGSIFLLSVFIYLERTLPDPESIAQRKVSESTKIYDRTGQVLLYDIHGEEKRTVIPWEAIPTNIKNATLAAEDKDFYNHKGIDIKGIIRAFLKDIASLRLAQGGSTITQQLVGNALVGRQQTFTRKIKEAILSIEVERKFSKDQIFWMYLNQIPYGSNAYGIEAASKTYFGKSASELTSAQAATLAALPKAPTFYSPYGSHVPELMARKNTILDQMKKLGYISEADYQTAIAENIPSEFKSSTESMGAPHFVVMVKEYLTQKYGEDAVENGGLKITTTLDADLQKTAESVVTKYSEINQKKYKASNAALVSIDPKTGEVLALVGSANYFDVQNQGNFNVITSPNRQPGSSFKPFAYAVALEKGYTDSTVLFDLKTEFNPYCSPDSKQLKDRYGLDCYHPVNYDGRYRGPVTLRQALAQSLNVPSVETLYLAGINDTVNLAKKMGLTTLTNNNYGLSLVLGGAEVEPIEMVDAYGGFANDGIWNPWTIVKRVEASDGTIMEEQQDESQRVLEPQVARLISSMLSDNSARAPVFGYSSPLYLPGYEVAAKTGTTQENRDAWVIGYTPSIVTGVWTGNNNNSPMTKEGAGISASGPMWNEFMTQAAKKFPTEHFVKPDPTDSNKIMIDGNYIFRRDENSNPEVHSILYYVNTQDPLGSFPDNPSSDPQFDNWEWSVRNLYAPTLPTPDTTPLPSPDQSVIPAQ